MARFTCSCQSMQRDNVKDFAKSRVEQNFLSPEDVINISLGGGRNDVEKTTEFLMVFKKSW